MKIRCIFFVVMFLSVTVAVAEETNLSLLFTNAVAKVGTSYRDIINAVISDVNATKHLTDILRKEPENSVHARQARLLLARIQNPEIFQEYEMNIQKWRNEEKTGDRPGLLSGLLMTYVSDGPVNKYVYVRDEKKQHSATNKVVLRGIYRKKVEKFTNAEVQAGVARNAAARQAVLEHFLKFLNEGDAYEQSEMVDLVDRLWGKNRSKRFGDFADTDNVKDAGDLIETVYKDESRPLLVRYTAALRLAEDKQKGIKSFMLNVVTNDAFSKSQKYEAVAHRALSYLESEGDAGTLKVLKKQSQGPGWKREKLDKTVKAIESRLSKKTEK